MSSTTVRTVTVTVDPPSSSGQPPVIVVSPETLDLATTSGAVVVQWQLETVGYTFPVQPPGIKVQNNTEGQFGTLSLSNDRRTATLSDENSDGTTYNYTVCVMTTSGDTHLHVDPVIKNHGQ